ncbi:MAG: rhomboid family intramembrane serine protease [Niastella sp.]|uniref:rhomboid family intramembrane serine protease n=1 Tax=Niastella sp. TaxID=1869183 RepID=UPI00389AC7D0
MLSEDRYRKKVGLGQEGNNLVFLIGVLAIVFCIFKFMWLVYKIAEKDMGTYDQNIFNWLVVPGDFEKMMTRPWTLLSFMFMHSDPWDMLGNILWLWAFGYIFQDLTGNKKLIPLFIYGSFGAALFFIASYNLVPKLVPMGSSVTLVGASAGIMAIAVAATTLAPDYRIFPMINGGIPLWILTVLYLVIDFSLIAAQKTPPGAFAHIAGAVVGFLFIYQMRRGHDWSNWMNNFFDWFGNLFNPDRKNWKKTAKTDLHYNTKGTQPYKKIPNITQKRIDEILDKINQQGYRFLTDEEKDILKRAAEDEEL